MPQQATVVGGAICVPPNLAHPGPGHYDVGLVRLISRLSMNKRFRPVPRTLSMALLASALLGGCATAPPQDRTAFGPHEVLRNDTVSLFDSQQEREVSLRINWPAGDGVFPVVVFSHGAFCYPQQYTNVTDFWVSHGYIVILPDHVDSPNGGKIKPENIAKMQPSRVRDMSFVLDSLDDIEREVPELAGRIDRNRAAVAGHSFGGMIAMIKTGLYMETQSEGQPVNQSDPRFRAALVMSGVGQMEPMKMTPQVPAMAANAFDGLTRPLIATGGSNDEGNVGTGVIYPWQWRMSPYTLAPDGDKYYLALEGADHYLGGLICREGMGGDADPVAVDVVRAAQTAFLDAYVKGDDSALEWLKSADYASMSGDRAVFEYK
jgi:dienelactone hydrolase